MKRIVLTCLSILLIPVFWQLLSWQMAQPQLIPSFPDLIRALFRLVYSPGFLVSIGTTLLRACAGLLLSLVAASITAFLLNRSEGIRFLFMPWLSLLRSVPVISFILLALIFRSIGVTLCLLGTNLNKKERLFCMIAYLPKATVQAAIGSVPLSMGLSCGKIVLSVAVLAILITAPLGALGMDATYRKLLQKNGENNII